MARIIGGIGTSHVPTIAMAFDRAKQADPDWQPLFEGYAPVARWLAALGLVAMGILAYTHSGSATELTRETTA